MDRPAIEISPTVGLRTFISYSRKDTDFVTMLSKALEAKSYVVDFDQSTQFVTTGIAPSDHWWVRIQDMIASADVVIVIISPDATKSAVVDEEVAYAISIAKRIIAVTCREVDFHTASPGLAALNVNHWFLRLDFTAAVVELTQALNRDVDWLRTSARLTSDAKLWRDQSHPTDLLLVGQEIAAAELWSVKRPAAVPIVSDLVLDYIVASRTAHHGQIERSVRQLRRTRRLQWAANVAILCVVIATVIGAYFVLDGNRTLSKSRSTVIARGAKQAYIAHDYVRALRLSLLASRDSFFFPSAAEAIDLLLPSARASRLLVGFSGHTGAVSDFVIAEESKTLLSWSETDQTLRLWDVSSGAELLLIELSSLNLGNVKQMQFSPDGAYLVALGERGWRAFTVSDGRLIGLPPQETAIKMSVVTFSRDSKRLAVASGGRLTVWSTKDFKEPLQIAEGLEPYSLSFTTDGTNLVLWERSGKLRQWNLGPPLIEGPSFTDNNSPESGANGLALSRNGQKAIIWGSNIVSMIDLMKPNFQFPPIDPDALTEEVTFSPDENHFLVATRGSTQPSPQNAYLFNSANGRPVGKAMQNDGSVYDAQFSSNGNRILTLSNDTVSIWNGNGELEPPRLRQHGIIAGVGFLQQDRAILTWGDDGIARIWDSETYGGNGSGTKRIRMMLAQIVHGSPIINAQLFAGDQRLVTIGKNGSIKIWTMEALPFDTPENYSGVIDASNKRPLSVSTEADQLLEWKPEASQRLWDRQITVTVDDRLKVMQSICSEKLRNTGSDYNNVRHIDDNDVELVPLLRGRETEDVCAWFPAWYEVLADAIRNRITPVIKKRASCESRVDQHFSPVLWEDDDIKKLSWPVRGEVTFDNNGIDIIQQTDSSVRAAQNGVIIYSGNSLKELGTAILMRHESGLVTVYGYLRELKVDRGMRVRQGDVIAVGFNPPNGEERLHFEVRDHAEPTDPTLYLPGVAMFCPQILPIQ